MTLATLAAEQVSFAFTYAKAQGLLEEIKYHHADEPLYDTGTQEVTESSEVASPDPSVLFETEGLKELADQAGLSLESFSGYLKCTVQASDLTRAAKTTDFLYRSTVRYNVVALITDPLELTYTLLVSRV